MDNENKAFFEEQGIQTSSKNGIRWRIAIGFVSAVLVYFLMIYALLPPKYDLNIGDAMPATVYATQKVEDKVSTEELRNKVAEQVPSQYSINTEITQRQISELTKYYNGLVQSRNTAFTYSAYDAGGKLAVSAAGVTRVNEGRSEPLTKEQIEVLLSYSQDQLLEVFGKVQSAYNEALTKGLYEENVQAAKLEYLALVPKGYESLTEFVSAGLDRFVAANMMFDEAATNNEKQLAKDKVSPIYYNKGQVVVYKGETITEAQYSVLKDLGVVSAKSRAGFGALSGLAIMLAVMYLLYYLYIYVFVRHVFTSIRHFLLSNLIIVLTIAICAFVLNWREYLMPIALAGFLTATLIDRKMANMANIMVCGLIGLIQRNAWSFFSVFIVLISTTAGIYLLDKKRTRYGIFFAGVLTASVSLVLNVAYSFIAENTQVISLLPALKSTINVGVATILCIGLSILFEGTFNLLTPSRLLDLGNTENKLLKELVNKAPGTYHHSVLVANLAEAAAEAVGANPLLTRVGAYYHDIGKLKDPFYFKENQSGKNVHDDMNPVESAKIIIAHTTDGLALAKKEMLPKEIRDIIVQHHGTTYAKFFYDKAIDLNMDVKEEDFRYPGPKPQTKEAALIMIADGLEAIMRLKYDKESARRVIRSVIDQKIREGQFDECDLSFRDITKIVNVLDASFQGMYHKRVAYKGDELL